MPYNITTCVTKCNPIGIFQPKQIHLLSIARITLTKTITIFINYIHARAIRQIDEMLTAYLCKTVKKVEEWLIKIVNMIYRKFCLFSPFILLRL